jgi:hypothetical protein
MSKICKNISNYITDDLFDGKVISVDLNNSSVEYTNSLTMIKIWSMMF